MTWFLRRLGFLTTGFALVSALLYTILNYLPILPDTRVSLDFIYYVLWSALSVGAFVRYITRPSALSENEEISDAFLRAFGVTARETDVIRLIGRGVSNQEIADSLGVSFATVRTHVYNVFQKTGAGSRVDLLRLVAGYRE